MIPHFPRSVQHGGQRDSRKCAADAHAPDACLRQLVHVEVQALQSGNDIHRSIDRLHRLAGDARRMLHRKHITLISISAVIWIAEITTAGLILGKGEIGSSAAALLRFLATVAG